MPRDVTHMFLWSGLFLACFLVTAGLLRWRGVREPWARTAVALGPQLVVLIWLHGVLFNPPNNWATLNEYGFWGFWFHPQQDFQYGRHWVLMTALSLPAVVFQVVATVLQLKSRARSGSWLRASITFVSWFFAAALWRHTPDAIMDTLLHGGRVSDSRLIGEVSVSLFLGALPFTLAVWLSWSLTRAKVEPD